MTTDIFSGEIVEKIPISAIQLCSTAADLQKQKEILLILTKPSEGAELYCFTCLATWAREIRDDINSAIKDAKKNSSSRPGTLSRQKQRRELEGKGLFRLLDCLRRFFEVKILFLLNVVQ